ncbi:TIGR03668 family PPOX class F420-dependent oxidoreductase [Kineococcus rhizosphaerae]|uniref:PPOX class probable F420-dependent enzyme n=1 Tax=Kineococcus rhizosphaerae TaxID=559628 RepID=A0A2T0R390_9ACTN|nr:TIGR03668 family PPOX class F420-dependent oxidoreductase [Kineococcus rhizosphaerae]PRY14491.1 PPOX class probable F420-dependent enzyme [Kineococcus rhizosphaerae]
MNLDPQRARELFAASRVARLATAGADAVPHLVPVTFALTDDDRVVVAVDAKPKRSAVLRRTRNVRENPPVALLADHYDEDWSRLWWVRADGVGRVVDAAAVPAEVDLLVARYPQLSGARPAADVLVVGVRRWSGWVYR